MKKFCRTDKKSTGLKLLFGVSLFFVYICFPLSTFAVNENTNEKAPKLANYYLGQLENSETFIASISKYDLLILSASQIAIHPELIVRIKKINPAILIFAYIPTQSYNTRYWPQDILLRDLHVQNSWWLTDPAGNTIEPWTNLKQINMQEEWSKYLVDFVFNRIAPLPNVDGIFFDLVSENISWLNQANIDLNHDGMKDNAVFADDLWVKRTTFFLSYARQRLGNARVIINGSSLRGFQQFINGRMFETFPTPWEGDGSWGTVMKNTREITKIERSPTTIIFNGNTNNTGNQNDYRNMRFGLTSALLENVYSSFDHGDGNHSQLWWYDEYDVSLGKPLSPVRSQGGKNEYAPDVWSRNFENGISVVNSTNEEKTVALGGEYEKIHGTQDLVVNDGSIVSEVTLAPKDGLILLKTFETLKNVLFTNGFFARFFKPTGERARNGLFLFEEGRVGGAQIAHIDLDFNKKEELLVVTGNKIQAWRDDGQSLFKLYPYGANYTGSLHVAIGDLNNDGLYEIYTAPSTGFKEPIRVYDRNGSVIQNNFFPFGSKYKGGYRLALTKASETTPARLIVGSGSGVSGTITLYGFDFKKLLSFSAFEPSFMGGVNVAAGDVEGDGVQEIIAGKGIGGTPTVKVFTLQGKEKYQPFNAYTTQFKPGIDVRTLDSDFDGKDEIVTLSDGAL